jgi:MFS family permease
VVSDRLLTRAFLLVVLAEFALCLSLGMLLAVVPVYADDALAVGSFGVAVTVSAASPLILVTQPLAGRLGDRRGRRVLVVAGGLVAAASVAAYAFADSLETLIALRLLTGIGEAMLLVGAATMITDLAPAHRRGEALSLYSLGLWGGLALGPFIGELVLDGDRFDAVWFLAAGCCLAAALIGLALPETGRRETSASDSSTRLIHPAAVGPGVVLSLTVLGFAGLGTFGALYARELGLGGGGPVFLVYAAVILVTRSVGRQVPDRFGPKATSRIALSLLAAGLLVIGLWNVSAGLLVGTVIVGVGHALAFPSLMTLAVNSAPPNERSSVVGTFTAFTELGFLVGSLTLGVVASAVGYDGVFIVCAIGPLLGLLALARIATPRATPALDAAT